MIQLASVKTASSNKQTVSELTKKLSLGTENVIARIAFAHSLSTNAKLDLKDIKDARGKEYSKSVIFGNYYNLYASMICTHYGIHNTDRDIPRYLKMHIDHGLELLYEKYQSNPGLNGMDFLVALLDKGIVE
jgi:DNA sulfur modification protein DndE